MDEILELKIVEAEDIENLVKPENLEEVKKLITDKPEYITKNLNRVKFRLMDRACRFGNFDLIKFIFEKNPDAIKHIATNNDTDALKAALLNGSKEIVEFLLEKGAIFERLYRSKVHPIYFCLSEGHYDLSVYLIERFNLNINMQINSNGDRIWTMPMIDYRSADKEEMKNKRIKFFLYCTSKLKASDLGDDMGYIWMSSSFKSDKTHVFFDELLRLKCPLKYPLVYPYPNLFSEAAISGDEYFVKNIIKYGISYKPILPSFIDKNIYISEYAMIVDKWFRLSDIYTLKFYVEALKNNSYPQAVKLLEEKGIQMILQKVFEDKRKSVIFRFNPNVFRKAISVLSLQPYTLNENCP